MSLEKVSSIEAIQQSIITEDEILQEQQKEAPPLSILAKARLILTNITVEPIMICYVAPCVMASLATANLSLEKACRVNLDLDPEICDALAVRNSSIYNKTDEIAVQKLVVTMGAWKTMLQSLLPTLLLLFLGSWSDRHQRRKPCILIPIVGEMFASTGFILCTYFFYQLPLEMNVFFEAVPPGITGSWFALFMGVYSYISDVSNLETRTLRIGAVNLLSNISITIGIALSGILYKQIGFYGVFSLALTVYITGFIYGLIKIKETPELEASNCKQSTKKINPIRDFFDWKHLKETARVAFKNGSNDRKKRICAIMILAMVITGPMHGEINVMYLFVRYKFEWNEIDYSLYSTFHFIAHTAGTVFSLMFFSKYLKVDDAVLGMISSLSKIFACVIYTFAPSPTIFYIGAIIEALNGTSFIAMRSIISKLVPATELGKINSIFGISEAMMPLIYGPMYTITYKYTIKVLPGFFFLLGGILTIPAVVIFFWLYRQHLEDKRLEQQEKKNEEAEKITLLQRAQNQV